MDFLQKPRAKIQIELPSHFTNPAETGMLIRRILEKTSQQELETLAKVVERPTIKNLALKKARKYV